ncbi:death ligand signal enhancer [Heliangelus exortis]|uniref:death ligand signal enhancer n=1 Tax=Heliangelus exortis TaxID=472823 RepID=UPI003A8FD496
MWRLLLGRGLGRCCPPPARTAWAAGPAAPDRPSTERAAGCRDGPGEKPLPRVVSRGSVLEAVTWGALGALLLQLVRHISWLRSVPDGGRERGARWRGSRPAEHTVVAEASRSCPSRQLASCFLQKGSPEVVPENSSSGVPSGPGESQPWAEGGKFQIPESSSLGPVLHSAKGDPAQPGHLEEAAFQLQQIFRIDISIALNILGIESMRAGHYETAYSCFKLAADRGYSKAQFNVALCYEHGRGTEKDLEKAGFYYQQAASSSHPMAQYRYARYLLRRRPGGERGRRQEALGLLEQAAKAGITEAQAYLGVFYMRGLQPEEKRGLKYLLLAAQNGDAQSRYHVGVCYEKGLGVQQNLAEAMRHYRESAAAGNRSAWERLQVVEEEAEDVPTKHPFLSGIRTSSSSPCFWAVDRVPADLQATCLRQPTLPHSWSADGLHTLALGWSSALGSRATPLELQCLQPHHCCH